ncbi:MAG: alpha/beta hydrolase [Candidatus Pelagadaptatus aseana]|uniref:alpha/beta fold hydrolase n=1 Tax=Candidatus Pelagadaptatus aseana TaxID=3120508 RepID=UPI0039B3574C
MNSATIKKIQLHSDDLIFSALSCGSGTPVFLLHGFPDTHHSWQPLMAPLAEAGFQVIAPACRGYEPCSIPADKDFRLQILGRDLLNWMDDLNIDRAHFVGHDWGSIIVQVATQLEPKRCLSLTTMAVPPAKRFVQSTLRSATQLRNSSYMGFFQLRGISERRIHRNHFQMLDRLWHKWSPNLDQACDKVKQAFALPGVTTAALSYYRQGLNPLTLRSNLKMFNRPFTVPTQAIYGTRDGCIDQRIFLNSLKRKDFAKQLKISKVENAGHFMNLEQPEQVSQLLQGWLQQHNPTTE